MVGMVGFEPTTTSPPARCATRLRYIPNHKHQDIKLDNYMQSKIFVVRFATNLNIVMNIGGILVHIKSI